LSFVVLTEGTRFASTASILACGEGGEADRVRLLTRHGTDFTAHFPKITAAVESLGVRSCVLDGEAIVVDEFGLPNFNALRYRLRDDAAVLCAFDLLELDGADLRCHPLEVARKIGRSLSPRMRKWCGPTTRLHPARIKSDFGAAGGLASGYPVVAVPDRVATQSVISVRSVRVITIRVIVRP